MYHLRRISIIVSLLFLPLNALAVPFEYVVDSSLSPLGPISAEVDFSITVDTFLGSYGGVSNFGPVNTGWSFDGSIFADFTSDLTSITLSDMNLLIAPPRTTSVGGGSGVVGSNTWQISYGLVSPLLSPLVPTGDPNLFLMGNTASFGAEVAISDLAISIPSVPIFSSPFSIESIDFVLPFNAPRLLSGTFSGDQNGTVLEIDFDLPGINLGTLSALTMTVTEGLPAGINSVAITPTRVRFDGLNSRHVVAASTAPIPEPSTILLVSLGIVTLTARRPAAAR